MRRVLPALLALLVLLALAWMYWGFRDRPEPADGVPVTRVAPETPQRVPVVNKPTLSGHLVRHGDRSGISGGVVTAACADGRERTALTAADGAFAFNKLPAGDCNVSASAPNFVAAGPSLEARTTARIVDGHPFENLELTLFAAASLSGRVTRAGQGVADARLSLVYHEAPGATEPFAMELEVKSDADGSFEVLAVGPGRLQVLAEHDTLGLAESADQFVQAGQRLANIHVELIAVGTVRGRVLRGNGEPVQGATVQVDGSDPARMSRALTDQDGTYRLDDVPVGTTTLLARAFGFQDDRRTLHELSAEAEAAQDFRLIVRGGFGGVVLDANGKPAPGASVGLRPGEAPPGTTAMARMVLADEDGRFWFDVDTLPFPNTVAVARHPTSGLSAPQRVSGRERDLRLQLTGGGQVSGTLTDGRGAAVESFRVEIVPMGGLGALDNASLEVHDPLGSFISRPIEPGRYRALLFPSDGRPPLETTAFQIAPSRVTALGTLRLPASGAIVGRVVDEQGQPIPGARVSAEGIAGMGMYGTVVTSLDGRFRIASVPAKGSLHVGTRGFRARLLTGMSAPDGGERNIGDVTLTTSTQDGQIQYVGVGLRLETGPGGTIRVSQAFPGSPAERAGVTNGATIVRVNGYDTGNLSMAKAIEMIRGEVGTEVSLELQAPDGSPYTVRLMRAEVTSN